MALNLKTKYPGQVDVADAGYPFGKARNVGTAGDGSGTPWEADLANDAIGFQQSLLYEAGITPNALPDKVGASQYLDALMQIITHLRDNEPAVHWASRRFTGTVTYEAGELILKSLLDYVGPDISYDPPRMLPKVIHLGDSHPLNSQSGGVEGWVFVDDGQAVVIAAGNHDRRWPLHLPHNTKISALRVGYVSGPASDVGVYLRRTRLNKTSPFEPTVTDLAAINLVGATTQEISSAGLDITVDNFLDTYSIDIEPSAVGQGFRYIELTVQYAGIWPY